MVRQACPELAEGLTTNGLRAIHHYYIGQLLDEDELNKFSHIAPDFVAELRSRSDSLRMLQDKMAEYIENGVRLGWLIDPSQRRVHIYRPGNPVEALEDPETVSGEDALPGFELSLQEIW